MYRFILYITGGTSTSHLAVQNLRALCQQWPPHSYALEIVDVLEDPERAERGKVIATPTLVRLSPEPTRRVIGDLSDTQRVMEGLELDPYRVNQTGRADDPAAESRLTNG